MNIDKLIEQWEEKHSSLLNEYSKGNTNNEVMQMYRSQMKNVLDFIEDIKQVKNNFALADVMLSLPDIRNKLSPISNLIAMLESSELMYHHETEVHKVIEREIEQCKKSIAYLSGNVA